MLDSITSLIVAVDMEEFRTSFYNVLGVTDYVITGFGHRGHGDNHEFYVSLDAKYDHRDIEAIFKNLTFRDHEFKHIEYTEHQQNGGKNVTSMNVVFIFKQSK